MKKETVQNKNSETDLKSAHETVTPTEVKTVNPTTSFMANKTLLLIGVLSLITVILLGLAFYTGFPQTVKPQTPPVKIVQTTLSIFRPVVSPAKTYTSDITLTTERKNITAVQIELTFDPKTLTNVDIKAGPFFKTPAVLLKKIDAVKGRISFVLGIGLGQNPIKGNGTVAILSFTPITKSGITTISFLKTSKATTSDKVQSILTAAKGIQFPFGPTPTP